MNLIRLLISNGQTAMLLAQMVWYFIDGFYNRKKDFPLTPKITVPDLQNQLKRRYQEK